MTDPRRVSDLRFFPGGWDDFRRGLLGYLAFRLADLIDIDGVTLRQRRDGELAFSWPRRRDAHGIEHSVAKPADAAAKAAIEAELLALLAEQNRGAEPWWLGSGNLRAPTKRDLPPGAAGPEDCLADLARPEAHQSNCRRATKPEARG